MFSRSLLSNNLLRQSIQSSSSSISASSTIRLLSTSSVLSASRVTKDDLTEMASQTDASELHPLPKSVRAAGKPSSENPSDEKVAASSRPSHPGPSGPTIDPNVAAPNHASRVNAAHGNPNGGQEDWATSFSGMSQTPFSEKTAEILGKPIDEQDIEVKPDGLLYLPEIKYRRILNKAFGPGGWGLAPRGETNVGQKIVSREWVLVCLGRFVSTARGEQEYFNPQGIATASEGAKSNALMRCCKDLGIASELWDPRFIRTFKKKHAVEVWCEGAGEGGKKRKLWRRKDSPAFEYPWKETGIVK